ncbi:SDR family oxidoreductase [Nocardia sp. NPDC058499]|uniref:SDR family oxidoreductase n=1 Tax=Nocardia sp. NPDC058499 TaxID=3346530 RepID=UPI00364640EA
MILLTAMPPTRNPGAVPTAPLVRLLADELTRRGAEVRVLTPAAEAQDWPRNVTVQIGEVTDPAAFATAVTGAQRVFLAGLVGESLAPLRDLVNALITAGSGRVVVLGSHGSDFEKEISGETWQWSAFERSLDKHGIGWAYLRPTALMAHALVGGYPIPGSGVVESIRTRTPVHEYLPDAPYAFIHERDLAEIAATVLLNPAHRGTIDVSGITVSTAERISVLETVLGLDAEVVELSAEQAAERWRRDGWPEDTIAVMLYALPAFAAQPGNPQLRAQEDHARALLGSAPRTFAQWATEFATRTIGHRRV